MKTQGIDPPIINNAVCPRVFFGQPQQLRSDATTRSQASNVYGGAVLLIVNAMTGKTQHGRFIVDGADGDEKDLTAFHCVHVHVRCESCAPRPDDFWRIEVWAYRMNRIKVRRKHAPGVRRVGLSDFDQGNFHSGLFARLAAMRGTRVTCTRGSVCRCSESCSRIVSQPMLAGGGSAG